MPRFLHYRVLIFAVAALFSVHLALASDLPPSAEPLALEKPQAELAGYMSQLQIYTHKLSLSVDAGNVELASFYMHESMALLEEIQTDAPEYEGIPVAVFVDRMGLPPYAQLREALRTEAFDAEALDVAMDGVVDGCNVCHNASQHGFIRIKRNSANPFMQSFEVADDE